jgi:hypothetical protein
MLAADKTQQRHVHEHLFQQPFSLHWLVVIVCFLPLPLSVRFPTNKKTATNTMQASVAL